MIKSIFFICSLLLTILSCTDDSPALVPNPKPTWLIPQNEVFDSGVGRDGIPSIDDPKFDKIQDVNKAFDDQLVIGLRYNGKVRGYPLPILDWHEIVNDEIEGLHIAITYCPLTGTAIGWSRKFGNTISTFGVSGLLFNSNLMPYDRRSLSIWSQQRLECVNGTRIGSRPETFSLIETTLATWRKSFPDAEIMNATTGFDRSYSFYPYGNYRTNHDLLFFPISTDDSRIPNKERVLGVIIEESVKAYRFNKTSEGVETLLDNFKGQSMVIIRSKLDNYNTAFFNPLEKTFHPIQDSLPFIMKDDQQNYYDLSGSVIAGPDKGTILERPQSFMGYWFSWPTFYKDVTIFQE